MGIYTNKLHNHLFPRIKEEYDEVDRSFTNVWANGKEWSQQSFRKNTQILLSLHVPCRKDAPSGDDLSWGGLYTEVLAKINSGNYVSLGHSGYDGVMGDNTSLILTYHNSFLYDPEQTEDYTIQFKFRHKTYDGTTLVNKSHDLSGEKFATHLRLEEIFKEI